MRAITDFVDIQW